MTHVSHICLIPVKGVYLLMNRLIIQLLKSKTEHSLASFVSILKPWNFRRTGNSEQRRDMRRQPLISTIALVAGLGVATAQETPKGAGGQGSSAVQQKQDSHGSGAAQKQQSRGSAQSHETHGENKGGEQGKQAQHEKQHATTGQGEREQGREAQSNQS